MIKHAKAGDIVYELDYNSKDKTCEIVERVVSLVGTQKDFNCKRSNIVYFASKSAITLYSHYMDVFKSPKAAHNAYLRVLANELKNAKQTIAKVEAILQQLRDAQAKY